MAAACHQNNKARRIVAGYAGLPQQGGAGATVKSFGAKKISRWSVDKLIEGIAGYLVKPEVLREKLYILEKEQWELFCHAAAQSMLELQESEIDLCAAPHILGLLQPYRRGKQYLCVVPQEIRGFFAQLLKEGLQEDYDQRCLLHTYAMAAVNLYGITPVEEFINIFNSQNLRHTDLQEISNTLGRSMLAQEALYALWKGNKYFATRGHYGWRTLPPQRTALPI